MKQDQQKTLNEKEFKNVSAGSISDGNSKYCPRCGTKNAKMARKCEFCGGPLYK